ncbi:MAG: hypothetical protein ACOCUR_02115, partial [Nanoarchaeota archaeon]
MDSFIRNTIDRVEDNNQDYDNQNSRDFSRSGSVSYSQNENKPEQAAPRRANDVDAELEQMLSKQKAMIKVIGCGGGGNNTINRISEVGIVGAETVAINTDAQDLLYTTADKKILVGKDTTKGLGAGSIPKVGEEAAREQEQEIKQAITGADMVFVTCGLGGGTGTGSLPVVSEIAKK